jgi:histidyl-tRNA synthetase
LKKSFETATKLGARFAIIVGENEVRADQFALKDLTTGDQSTVPRRELAARIQLAPIGVPAEKNS